MAGIPQDIGQFPTLRDSGDILLALYDDRYARYQPIWPRYMKKLTGRRYTETIMSLVGPTELETVSETQQVPYTDIQEGYKQTATVVFWAKGLMFTEAAFKFDLSGRLKNAAEKLALSARYAEEARAARVLNNALTTVHAGSGVALASASNLIKRSGATFSNRVTGDLSVATFDAARVLFRRFLDDSGMKLNIEPRFLIVSPEDERVARQIIGSDREPYTPDNQINVFRNIVEVIVNPWLTDTDNWFLVAGPEENGLDYIEWQGMRRKAWVDYDTALDTLKFKATMMMDATFDEYRGFVMGVGV